MQGAAEIILQKQCRSAGGILETRFQKFIEPCSGGKSCFLDPDQQDHPLPQGHSPGLYPGLSLDDGRSWIVPITLPR